MSLGLGAAIQSGCGNTIKVIASPDQPGKLILNPQQNDTIEWQASVNPKFLGPAPCEGGKPQNGKCKVNQTSGKYLYKCDVCKDPEVVVGPDIPVVVLHSAAALADAAVAPELVSLWCDNNQVALDPAEVDFTAKSGDTVQTLWVNTGSGSSFIKDWQVNFTGTSPCTETQIGDGHDNTCTIKVPALPPPPAPTPTVLKYTYTASSASSSCKTPNLNGIIQVTVQ
jgi:hypothetical protein